MNLITCTATPSGTYKDTTDAAAYTNASDSYAAGKLYSVQVSSRAAAGLAVKPTMTSSASITLSEVGTSNSILTTLRTTQYVFVPSADTSGTITATFSGAQTQCFIFVQEIAHTEVGNNGLYAIRNLQIFQNSTLVNSVSITMGSFARNQNATFASFAKQNGEGVTVTGVSEVQDDATAAPLSTLTTGFSNDNQASPTFAYATNNNNGVGIAFELIASTYPKSQVI